MAEEEFESDADEVEMRMLDYHWSSRELGAGTAQGQAFLTPHIQRLLEIVEYSSEQGARLLAAFALTRPGSESYPISYRQCGPEIVDRLTRVADSCTAEDSGAFTDYLGVAITMVIARMAHANG